MEFAGNDIHRQHVRWERGGDVWVNRGADAWTVEGHTLPKYGFYLRAGAVEAAIELKGAQRVEWSRSPREALRKRTVDPGFGKGYAASHRMTDRSRVIIPLQFDVKSGSGCSWAPLSQGTFDRQGWSGGLKRDGTMAVLNRRTFLGLAAGISGLAVTPPTGPLPIIDTHIHLFDPSRPQGVPWPDRNDTVLYQPALPRTRYRKVTKGLGVVGAIEVGAAPGSRSDNQWVLDIAAEIQIIVGTVGDLEPGTPGFPQAVGEVPS